MSSAAPVGGALDVIFIRSRDAGLSWESPRRVNQFRGNHDDSQQWFGMMDVAPNGRIDVLWNDTRNDETGNNFSELYYAASFDGGDTWHYDIPVSKPFNHYLGYPVQQKLGDYYDLESDDDGVNVIYAATFNGEQDIYFLRVDHFDCNDNGTLDVEEIAAGTLADCNDNDLPDSCEIATAYSPDCNGNGMPDDCDMAAGNELDCNGNLIPDACEIAADMSLDCDGNGIPDSCDLAASPMRDCDENGVIDSCDIATGAVTDCNGNGRPDSCDLVNEFEFESPQLTPIGVNSSQMHTLPNPPVALGEVTLTIRVRGDFNFGSETLNVSLNDELLGTFFGSASDCPATPNEATVMFDAADFNARVSGGDATLLFTTSTGVDPNVCDPASYVQYAVEYLSDIATSDDENMNGIPDECEFAIGDLNCDGAVTVSDIGPFVLAIVDPAAYVLQFPSCNLLLADANNDGAVTVSDIGDFVSLVIGG